MLELENVIRNIVVLNEGEQVNYEMLPPQLLESQQAGIDRYIQKNKDKSETPDNISSEFKEDILTETETIKVTETVMGFSDNDPKASTEIRPLWQEEKMIIERAISLCDGNIPKAATYLEVSASTIYRKRLSWEKD